MERELRMGEFPVALLDSVRGLLQELVTRLPVGVAEIQEQPSPDLLGPVELLLTSRVPGAIGILAHVVDGEAVSLWMSDGSVFEVFDGKGAEGRAKCIETVRIVCQAVVEGGYEATVWRKRGVTVRSRVLARARGSTRSSFWATWSNPFVRAEKVTRRAAPWDAGSVT